MYNSYPSGPIAKDKDTEEHLRNLYGNKLPKNSIHKRLAMLSYLLEQQNAKTQQ